MAHKKLRTFADVAAWQSVSVRAVEGWRRRPDWPARDVDGTLSRNKLRAFLKRHKLGEFREKGEGKPDRYRDAMAAKADEQVALLRLQRERALVEQAKELGQLLYYDDVKRIFTQATGAIQAELGGFVAAIDAALGDSASPELRARVIAAAERSVAGVYSAVRLLFTKGDDDGKATTT